MSTDRQKISRLWANFRKELAKLATKHETELKRLRKLKEGARLKRDEQYSLWHDRIAKYQEDIQAELDQWEASRSDLRENYHKIRDKLKPGRDE